MHEIEVRVRFCETDALGHVNNASYFQYMEEARIRFFEDLGYKIEDKSKNWNFVVASVGCDFLSQAFFNQSIKIQTFVKKIGSKSFTLENMMVDAQTGKPIAKGHAVVVIFDFETQKSTSIPEYLYEGLTQSLIHQ
ncbi:acyl-CoA thioesterase [Bacillus dakarensis]|uniref:acyl-CoA thioesterase n=1 Tax=Robertmurraya dakarensis TaxID=1926278 RepID=UPI00098145F0|nr:thioesterase family protein [Bacillus dakarensis]